MCVCCGVSEAVDADAKDNATPNRVDSMRARHSQNTLGMCLCVLADAVAHLVNGSGGARVSEKETGHSKRNAKERGNVDGVSRCGDRALPSGFGFSVEKIAITTKFGPSLD